MKDHLPRTLTPLVDSVSQAICIMGIIFRLSWGIVYAVILAVTSLLAALLLRFGQVLPESDIFVLFLLLYMYGLSIVMFAFMITPFFSKAEVSNSEKYVKLY